MKLLQKSKYRVLLANEQNSPRGYVYGGWLLQNMFLRPLRPALVALDSPSQVCEAPVAFGFAFKFTHRLHISLL